MWFSALPLFHSLPIKVMAELHGVGIFWDYENCHPSSSLTGYEVVEQIRRIARPFGYVKLFKAYVELTENPSQRSPNLRSEIQCSGVSLTDCPHNGRKEVADKMILVDMFEFAIDNPSPATIILISGDRDFAYALSKMRLRRYTVVLIAHPQVHQSLTAQADVVFDWCLDVSWKCNSETDGDVCSLVENAKFRNTPGSPSTSIHTSSTLPRASPVKNGLTRTRRYTVSSSDPRSRSEKAVETGRVSEGAQVPSFRSGVGLAVDESGESWFSGSMARLEDGMGVPKTWSPAPDIFGKGCHFDSNPSSGADKSSAGIVSVPSSSPGHPILQNGTLLDRFVQTSPSIQREISDQNRLLNPEAPLHPRSSSHPLINARITSLSTFAPIQPNPSTNYPEVRQQLPNTLQNLPSLPSRPSTAHRPATTDTSAGNSHEASSSSVSEPLNTLRPLASSTLSSGSKPQPSPSPLPSTSKEPGLGKSQQTSNAQTAKFRPLIEVLTTFRAKGETHPLRSRVNDELLKKDKLLYLQAGMTNFRQYAAAAESACIVQLGFTNKKDWITLRTT